MGLPGSLSISVCWQVDRFNLKFVQDDKHFYNDVSPKIYEVWGCAELDKSGSWDSWTKLLHIENEKPSGLPGSELTEDDRLAAKEGDNAISRWMHRVYAISALSVSITGPVTRI